MEIKSLIELMNLHIEQICQYLLPNGRKIGNEWRIGSVNGEPGKSMGVHLSGDKTGIWKDFAGEEKGDLLELWKEIRNVSTVQAINEIKNYLGIYDNKKIYNMPRKIYQRPKSVKSIENNRAKKYLIEKRKLTEETLEKYKVKYIDKNIVFQYFKNGELINNKYLWFDKESHKKQLRTEKNAEQCLYGWQAIDDNQREIVICEGEIDAMTMSQYGFPALSVPYGAGTGEKNNWIENDYDLLDRFDTLYICMDMDDPGRQAAKDIAERLGYHRCKIVELPYNDVNDCLLKGITASDMADILDESKYIQPVNLKDSYDFVDEICEEINPTKDVKYYSPQFHSGFYRVRMFPEEVTILGGISGAGKTTFLMQLALDMVSQKHRIVIASLEQKPPKYLKKLVKQAIIKEYPSNKEIREIMEWLSGNIFVYNYVGMANKEDILKTFEYAFRRFGVDFFIIDSLTKLGIAEDDYNGQKAFVDELTNIAVKLSVHIILVVHSRKLSGYKQRMTKMDLKGSGAISDLASNVWILTRNKQKEDVISGGKNEIIKINADVILEIAKQREMGWQGAILFDYTKKTETYNEVGKAPIKYFIR